MKVMITWKDVRKIVAKHLSDKLDNYVQADELQEAYDESGVCRGFEYDMGEVEDD